jgi:hypothetical protein
VEQGKPGEVLLKPKGSRTREFLKHIQER